MRRGGRALPARGLLGRVCVSLACIVPDTIIGDPACVHLARLRHAQMPVIERFFDDPVVDRIYGGRAQAIPSIEDHIDSGEVTPFLIMEGGDPRGYLQIYHANEDEFWDAFGVPRETFGMDLFLSGEQNRRRGLGRAAIQLGCTRLWRIPDIVRIQIDPDPANGAAIRAYAKAGFIAQGIFPGYESQGQMLYMTMERP
jgi:aminoglycoside 6'-N-acetyltransferase